MTWLLDTVLQQSTFIHAQYIILIFALFIENRSANLMLYRSIDKNITVSDILGKFKTNMVTVQSEQIRLIKEQHSHSYEIQMLNQQLARLREELKTLNK